jgi:hypothetical protein
MDQDAQHERYALQYGPTLLALTGSLDLDIAASALPDRLSPAAATRCITPSPGTRTAATCLTGKWGPSASRAIQRFANAGCGNRASG